MRPTRSPAWTPLAMRPAAMALTSVANSLAVTGVQRLFTRRVKTTSSGLVRARSFIASMRQASGGTSTTCGLEYSCTGWLLSVVDGSPTYRGAPRGAGLLHAWSWLLRCTHDRGDPRHGPLPQVRRGGAVRRPVVLALLH